MRRRAMAHKWRKPEDGHTNGGSWGETLHRFSHDGAVEERATKRAHEPRAQWSTCHQQNRTAMIHESQQIRSANSGLFFKATTFPLRRSPFFKLGTCLQKNTCRMRGLPRPYPRRQATASAM